MKTHRQIIFTPFNIRNKIINENNGRDIDSFTPTQQKEILKSYMPENTLGNMIVRQRIKNTLATLRHSKHRGTWVMNLGDPSFLKRGVAFDDTDLKAYWKFDEASGDIINQSESAADLGAAADLQVTGATYSQAGKIGNSLLFDGVDDHCVAGTSLSQFNFMHNTSALWTVAIWVKLTTSESDTLYNFMGDNPTFATANIGINIFLDDRSSSSRDHQINVLIARGVTGQPVIDGLSSVGFFPKDTNWHLLVATYNQSLGSNNLQLIMDGDTANKELFTKTANAPSNSDSSNAMWLAETAGGTADFAGNLDEVSVWNRVLSDEEITALYNAGNGRAIY